MLKPVLIFTALSFSLLSYASDNHSNEGQNKTKTQTKSNNRIPTQDSNDKFLDPSQEELDAQFLQAIVLRNARKVSKLLKMGADVNAKSSAGETPLYVASRLGYTEITQLLIDNGADVNAKSHFLDKVPLHVASAHGHIEIVPILLKNGADVNARDIGGKTALHLASRQGQTKIAQLLIDNGADVNAKSHFLDETPLHVASAHGHIEMVQLLIDNRADVNAKDSAGWTVLDFTNHQGQIEIAQILRSAGAVE